MITIVIFKYLIKFDLDLNIFIVLNYFQTCKIKKAIHKILIETKSMLLVKL